MLRALTGRRGEIARCMAFSLEHAEAASEVIAFRTGIELIETDSFKVSDIIVSSILIDETPVPRKVARLHLICDILHNSAASVSNAWKFRQEFQSRLGLIFDHLSSIYHSFPGRITADSFKNQITAIVDVWEEALVFPSEFTQNLRLRLEGLSAEPTKEDVEEQEPEHQMDEKRLPSRFNSSAFKPAGAPTPHSENGTTQGFQEDIDGEPTTDVDGEPMDNVDGEPMDDVDGEPMDDVDGEPMDNVDGEPMDNVDGDPM
jgi:U2-associated protein SR140